MLVPEDFSLDTIIMRQVKRVKEAEAREDHDEDDDENPVPRGTQANRPQELGSDEEEEVEEEDIAARGSRVKRERTKSRGPSGVPAQDSSDIDMED
jgi:hypothetical protein